MSLLFRAVTIRAQQSPDIPVLQGAESTLTYAELAQQSLRMGGELHLTGIKTLGLLADNGIAWAVADLSALCANILLVPLPPFFSAQQLQHAIHDSGVDGILTDQPERVEELLAGSCHRVASDAFGGLQLVRITSPSRVDIPAHTAKITYTSGTTGKPKGVCLSRDAMESVAQSLCNASLATPEDKHLCLLPLSTLLENIGGIYVPLLAGACSCVLPLHQVGLKGTTALDVEQMLNSLHEYRSSTIIMVPQMLHALAAALGMGAPVPMQLRFIAVGGAPVSPRLLAQTQQLGLPVYEGYGLSECASVVSLNVPGLNKPGSVGRPLPHVRLKFADDSEIKVGGVFFSGYLGQTESADAEGFWPTGDTGYLDDEGYLYLTGRKKNMFITSFGRNVAPEWVERELTIHPAIAQAAVFGEAQPWNAAVLVPRPLPGVEMQRALTEAIAEANQTLPDYARINKWIVASEPFTSQNGLLTANGRLRREEIWSRYEAAVGMLYQEEPNGVL